MRVLLINNVYNIGSTGKIVHDIKQYLDAFNVSTYVAYGNFDSGSGPDLFKFGTRLETKITSIFAKFGWFQYMGGLYATIKLLNYIKSTTPDIVHIHCLNGYCVNLYLLLLFLSRNKYRTIVTHHAEFYYTGSCSHSYDCMQFINNSGCIHCPMVRTATHSYLFNNTKYAWKLLRFCFSRFEQNRLVFTAVSPWVMNRSLLSPIVNNFKCECVLNGCDIQKFQYSPDREIVHNVLGKSLNDYILYVTPHFDPQNLNDIKGSRYIITLAKMFPSLSFIVVSSSQSNISHLPNNVYVWGVAESQEQLANLYSNAHLTLLLSKRETFSMVTAESLCCGTPVVGFKSGGPESIAIDRYTCFVEYGDIAALAGEIVRFCKIKFDKHMISSLATSHYSKNKMAEKYLQVYYTLLK